MSPSWACSSVAASSPSLSRSRAASFLAKSSPPSLVTFFFFFFLIPKSVSNNVSYFQALKWCRVRW